MCCQGSIRCLNLLILLALLFGIISMILGILAYFLPFLYYHYEKDRHNYGFFFHCKTLVVECITTHLGPYRVAGIVTFVLGLFFNIVGVIFLIVLIIKNRKYLYLPNIILRIIAFIIFFISFGTYLPGMILAIFMSKGSGQNYMASFILGWITVGVVVIVLILLVILLICSKRTTTSRKTVYQKKCHDKNCAKNGHVNCNKNIKCQDPNCARNDHKYCTKQQEQQPRIHQHKQIHECHENKGYETDHVQPVTHGELHSEVYRMYSKN